MKVLLGIRRCRANCLKESPHNFPVFSPPDEVVVAEKRLNSLAYIEKRVSFTSGQNVLAQLSFTGSGSYTKSASEFVLHNGIIRWEHVKFGLGASWHLPKDILKRPLTQIAEAWGDKKEARLGTNAMIGLWVENPDYCDSRLRTTSEECDDQMGDCFCNTSVSDLGLWDYVYRTRFLTGGVSMRPMHDLIMNLEHVRMAQALQLITERHGSVIRKAQFSPRVWIVLTITREIQGKIMKKQEKSRKSRVLISYIVFSIRFLITLPRRKQAN